MSFFRFFRWYWAFVTPHIWPAIIAGAASLVGGIMGNKASAKEAAASRDQALYMSNTAHQREVKDLEAAGLNPMLSGMGGSGASTTPGPAASQSDVVTPAVHSAIAANQNEANQKILESEARIRKEHATQAYIDTEVRKVAGRADAAEADNRYWRAKLDSAPTGWVESQGQGDAAGAAYFTRLNELKAGLNASMLNASGAGDRRRLQEQITAIEKLTSDEAKAKFDKLNEEQKKKLIAEQFEGDLGQARVHSSSVAQAKRWSDLGADAFGNWSSKIIPGINSAQSARHNYWIREGK